jgi:hypothetical protein
VLGPWGDKGRVGQSQSPCVVMEVTQGVAASGPRVGETGETARMGGFFWLGRLSRS